MALPARPSSTAVGPWDPRLEFTDLQDQMGRLVQSLVDTGETGAAWWPPADVSETDDGFTVEIELPGVKDDAIDADPVGNELPVSGRLKDGEEKTGHRDTMPASRSPRSTRSRSSGEVAVQTRTPESRR